MQSRKIDNFSQSCESFLQIYSNKCVLSIGCEPLNRTRAMEPITILIKIVKRILLSKH
jgi:hypothetical protein